MITPAEAEAVAKCAVFGVLPAYGFYLLYLSVERSLRTGRVWWFTAGATSKLYNRMGEPAKFWAAFCTNFFAHFSICAVPFLLFAFIFLPRLVQMLRDN
jgi:hypothetical protein